MHAPERWTLETGPNEPAAPPAHRPVHVGRLSGYVDPVGVRPGERLRVHLSAPAAHTVSIARLGRSALLDPSVSDADDRAEAELLSTLERPRADRHDVHPGSYAWLDDASLGSPAGISLWLRLWRVPSTVEAWSWSALVTRFDFPDRCGWALAVDELGRPACYLGDGGAHSQDWWTFGEESLERRLGEWVHMACSLDRSGVRLYVDGLLAGEGTGAVAGHAESPAVRIAAAAEGGVVDHLLDADLSDIALFDRPLGSDEVTRLAEDRALSSPSTLGIDCVTAHWPLRETAGARLGDQGGHERHAALVNGATLGIPGPAASSAIGRPGYDPALDPTRGGAVRFASDDLVDCGWPSAAELTVPQTADSGTYCVSVSLQGADDALEIPFVVVRRAPRRRGSVALLFPTFTWTAYARRPVDDVVVPGLASSFYDRTLGGQPFFHLGMRMPLPRAQPFAHRTHLRGATLQQHIVRPERLAESWLARERYAYECITDVELDAEPELLDRFAALMIVGHSEYWSQRMRDGVRAYLDGGGDVLCLSGNNLWWRVSYDAATKALEARKTVHAGRHPSLWLRPDRWGERWHADGRPGGAWSLVGEPTNELLGLESLGYTDSGDPAAFAPFTVEAADHFLFHEPEQVPLEPGGLIGTRSVNGTAVSGYEMDGLPSAVGKQPASSTQGLVLLAHAQHQYRYLDQGRTVDPRYGADAIYWERPGGGRLFNAASVGYTGSLAVDPGIQALTRNVLHHFEVGRCG